MMNVKDNYTREEWNALLGAPMLVSYAVAGSAPSGEKDFTQEMSAVADGIIEGGSRAGQNSLLASVVADIVANAGDEDRGQTQRLAVGDAASRALENCRLIAGVLRTKASAEEAYEYKKWILSVAHKVASAAKEGGIFGFGGEQVSGNEVAIINEIGEALDI